MGKIKSKSIRKAAKVLSNEGVEFGEDFGNNKKILEGLVMSKKLRNQLAGLTAKAKKREIRKLNMNVIP
jgi:ribosomal protein S17E